VNLSPDGSQQDYLADGLTEGLITNLSRNSALRVISRTSVMPYKGGHKTLPEIGRELNVDGIVEGAVRRNGSRVRVDVKLIQAASEKNILVDVYERDLEEILSLENEISTAIARRTDAAVTARESDEFSRSRRLNPEVYEAYLKGRFFWNARSKEGLEKAIKYFERTVVSDPGYARGYAGLADCFNLLSFYGAARPQDSFPRAKAAAHKALELDENTAEAHAALGYALLHFDWDWTGADAEFRRSLALNPGYANAHHWHSHYLLAVGRTQDALAATKRALELDPLNQSINSHLGHHLLYVERYDDAIAQMQTALEMNPASARSHALLGRAYEGKQMFGKAKQELQEAIRLSNGDARFKAGLAHVFATEGNFIQARTLLNQLEHASSHTYISPYALAEVHAALGKPDRAFENLALACDRREEELIYVKTDPNLKSLHSDARFNDLVRRLRLPL
jgi:adenylate cyclase